MKIKSIKARELRKPEVFGRTEKAYPNRTGTDADNPLSRYREAKSQGVHFKPPWRPVVCVATAEDGTFGMGMTTHAGPVNAIINDYFSPLLEGESIFATEHCWDSMTRVSGAHFGAAGLASYAISAVDLALWDLKGKILGRPVYELLGGPSKDAIHCYATSYDVEWARELGFDAIKIVAPHGSAEPTKALNRNVALVAEAREQVGPDVDLMIDFWHIGDLSFAIEVAERLREFNLRWVEDYVFNEDEQGYDAFRQRVPWQTLASGERWHTTFAFQRAAQHRVVDIFQPDAQWVGGVTTVMKINAIAEAAGISLAIHLGGNDSYGQHICYALANNLWGEFFVDGKRGTDLRNGYRPTPGMSLPVKGKLKPSDAPGFGIELTREMIEAAT